MKTRRSRCGDDRDERLKDRNRVKNLGLAGVIKSRRVKDAKKRKIKKNRKTKTKPAAVAVVDNGLSLLGHQEQQETEPQPPQPRSSQSCFMCRVQINNGDGDQVKDATNNQNQDEKDSRAADQTSRFLKMVTRYLKLDPMKHCQEKSSGTGGFNGSNNPFVGTIAKGEGEDSSFNFNVVKACASCSGIIAKFCELFEQRDTIDLLMTWHVKLLRKNMELGQGVKSPPSSGKETLSEETGNENDSLDEKTGPETPEQAMMDGFRKEFWTKSIALGFPKVGLEEFEKPVSPRNGNGPGPDPDIPLAATVTASALANNTVDDNFIHRENLDNFQSTSGEIQNPSSVSTIGEDLDDVDPDFAYNDELPLPTLAAAGSAAPAVTVTGNDFPPVGKEVTNDSMDNAETIGIETNQCDQENSKDVSPETEETSPEDMIKDQEPASNSSADTIQIPENLSDLDDDHVNETYSGPGTDVTQFDSQKDVSGASVSSSSPTSPSSGSLPSTSRATVINRNVGHDHELIDISGDSDSSDDNGNDDDEEDDGVGERTVFTQTFDEIDTDSESHAGSSSVQNELQFQQPQNQLAIPEFGEELDEFEDLDENEYSEDLDENEEMESDFTYEEVAPPPPQFQDEGEDYLIHELRDVPDALNLNLEPDENFYYMHQRLLEQQQQQQFRGTPQSRASGTRVYPFMPAASSPSFGVNTSNLPPPPPRQVNNLMMDQDNLGYGQQCQTLSQPEQAIFMADDGGAGASTSANSSSSPYDYHGSPSTSNGPPGPGSLSQQYPVSPQGNPINPNINSNNNTGNGRDFPFNGFDIRPEVDLGRMMPDIMYFIGNHANLQMPPPPTYHSPGFSRGRNLTPFEMEEFEVDQPPPPPPSFDYHNLMPD